MMGIADLKIWLQRAGAAGNRCQTECGALAPELYIERHFQREW